MAQPFLNQPATHKTMHPSWHSVRGPSALTRRPLAPKALSLEATTVISYQSAARFVGLAPGSPAPVDTHAAEAAMGGAHAPPAGATPAAESPHRRAVGPRSSAARTALVAVHAVSSAAFMAGAAAVELFTTLPVLTTGSGALYYPATAAVAWGWAGLTAASAASGWALASRERRGAERSNFQDYAVQAVLGQLFTLWLSPYWPRAAVGGAADVAMGVAIVATSVMQLATQASATHRAAIAHGRRDKSQSAAADSTDTAAAPSRDLPKWAQSAAYFQPAAVGPVMMLAAGAIQACVPFTWLSAFQAVHPEHAAIAFHFGLITTLAGHAGMFAPTLRDKRRISQQTEAVMCAVSNYAALGLLVAFMVRFPWLWQVAGPWSTLFPIM